MHVSDSTVLSSKQYIDPDQAKKPKVQFESFITTNFASDAKTIW